MLKMADREDAIRHLCYVWARECGIPIAPQEQPSWSQFKSWLQKNHYSHYLNLRSTTSADSVAENWFDQEFKQTWRN
jgi:hypothetical protein